jgi:hypothetical protein
MQTVFLPGRNADTVNPNTPFAKAFDVKNTASQALWVTGIILKYKTGLEKVLVNIRNRKAGSKIDLTPTGEGVRLSAIGTPLTNKMVQVFKVRPFLVDKNGSVDVELSTSAGETVNPFEVELDLVCESVEPPASKRHTVLIPFRNDAAVGPGISKTFEVKNGIRDFDVVALIVKHKANLERIRLSIQSRTAGADLDVMPSNVAVALCSIGSAFDSTLLQIFRLKPFKFRRGIMNLVLSSETSLALTAAVNDVDITFVCEYEG